MTSLSFLNVPVRLLQSIDEETKANQSKIKAKKTKQKPPPPPAKKCAQCCKVSYGVGISTYDHSVTLNLKHDLWLHSPDHGILVRLLYSFSNRRELESVKFFCLGKETGIAVTTFVSDKCVITTNSQFPCYTGNIPI